MKNIHILPTDKPSMLCFRNYLFINKDNIGTYSNVEFKNIYITSDEEIKEGDYIGYPTLNIWTPIKYLGGDLTGNEKKIILTTDQDLIKDGVQAIDDEFLEWFVNNPSCEEVDIKLIDTFKKTNDVYVDEIASGNYYQIIKKYKIIIPKEELTRKIDTRKPKQYPIGGYAPGNYSCTCVTCKINFIGDKRAVQCEPCAIVATQEDSKQEYELIGECNGNNDNGCFMDSCGHNCGCFIIQLKEDPIDKIAKNFVLDNSDMRASHSVGEFAEFAFKEGAKWQAENSYSEEEVYKIIQKLRLKLKSGVKQWQDDFEFDIEKWFEKNKKV